MRQLHGANAWAVMTVVAMLVGVTGCESGGAHGGWVDLYNGQDLTGWKARHPDAENQWRAVEEVELDPNDPKKLVAQPGTGVLWNGPAGRTTDIYTEREFGDCEAHIEFLVAQESNSGVYFMGRYEIQILDSYGKSEVTFSDVGGIYARWIDEQNVEGRAPKVNAAKAPGEWQSFDVVFRAPRFDAGGNKIEDARFVSVRLNGQLIHENVSLTGMTRSGLSEKEVPRGPLMLQGDHGPVAFRHVRIKPLDD